MSRRFLLPLGLILCVAALGVTLFMFTSGEQDSKRSAIGGPFHLTSANGSEVTDADFKGHPFLVYFGYTHCPDICPTVLSQMSQVLEAIGDYKKIKAIFITVDPGRDTPPVMKQYLSSFDSHIIGLSGTREEIDAIERAYLVYARKSPGQHGDYTIDHTAFVFLMDKDGRFITPFDVSLPPQVAVKYLAPYF
jgi:protein SCO1